MKNSFLPSRLTTGAWALTCPKVKCTGSRPSLSQKGAFSRMAQMLGVPLRVDWKTKYSPLGVQLPQHSAGGLFQPGSSGWRCVPSAAISQRLEVLSRSSWTVRRTVLESGDQRGHKGRPFTVAIFVKSLPSLEA